MSDTEKAVRAGLTTFGPSPLLAYYRAHRNAEFVAARDRLLNEMEARAMALIFNTREST